MNYDRPIYEHAYSHKAAQKEKKTAQKQQYTA